MNRTYAGDQAAIDNITSSERPVFERLNNLLISSGLAVTIEDAAGEEILARHQNANEPYSIAQMSDGERNAVILAANVLTVEANTVLLIDEPERHLHRSIIEPFLSALFAKRSDCPFVVSTHDTALPMANPEASVLVLRSCQWTGERGSAWDATFLEGGSPLPEDLKRAILGSRRRILFVEGRPWSLDIQLYDKLFPDISVVPVASCDDVVKSVAGMRNAESLHDVAAFGLIDRDNREEDDVKKPAQDGIYALNICTVESLYYCSDAIRAVAHLQASALGEDADHMVSAAKDAGLSALRQSDVAERMAARRCERRVRDQLQRQLPDWKAIMNNAIQDIVASDQGWYQEELNRLVRLIADSDLDSIVARYPVRESNVLDEIVGTLQLNRPNYQRMLRVLVQSNVELAERLKLRIGPLSRAMS